MKKLVLTGFHHLELVEADIPTPEPGQAIIRIKYAGICGSDLHVLEGLHPTAKPPLVMGHEACGELYAINDERTDIQVGDKVCCHTVKPCNTCEGCQTGRENLCTSVKIMGTSLDGVFTQYMLVDADRLIRFDEKVDEKIAALVEPLTVGVHDLRRSGFQAGESVFISGAGPIGLIIGIMAKFSGASCVVLSEIDPIRIRIAREMGFTVVSPTSSTFEADCTALSPDGFDNAFEITSVQSSFDVCAHRLRRGGTLVQVGMPPAGRLFQTDINKFIYNECNLKGVRHHTIQDMQCAARIINSGSLNEQLSKLVSAIYPMEQYAEAFRRAKEDKSMLRVLIDFT